MIYLDNAATGGKKPEGVIRAVENALRQHSANPGRGGHKASLAAGDILYKCRSRAAEFFGAEREEQVCFTGGCTAALNMALKGVLSPGDGAVISHLEHNAVVRPLHALSKRGITVERAVPEREGDDGIIDAFRRAIRPNTRVIVCTHASNVTGQVMPVARLGELCKKHGLILIVDAAQSAGVIPINMVNDGIHILCAAPHKGLLSPMGLGLLISRVELPNTVLEGGTGSISLSPEQPDDLPERVESGTVNLPAVAGLSAAFDILKHRDNRAVYNREIALITAAWDSLSKNGRVRLYTPRPVLGKSVPLLSFNIEGLSSADTAARLDERGIAVRGGLHCAPLAHQYLGTEKTGTVRISTSYFNTPRDISALVSAVNTIAREK